jgi:tRNA(Ile)-lysidine synthase
MLDKIAMILRDECHLVEGHRCVVGVSGGPDSICLLHVLHELGYHLVVVHVNHHLRPESDQEANFVAQFTHGLGVDCHLRQVDVLSYAEEQSLSVEESARDLRYQVLFEEAQGACAEVVMVAHNANDQVETILLHLLRGTGLAGLCGMDYYTLPNAWSTRIALGRPLISFSRQEILRYLSEHNLTYTSDQSNEDTSYSRNRLRHELLPELESYNPQIRKNLLRLSQVVRQDYTLLQILTAEAWEANWINQGPGYVSFRLSGFRQLEPSIQNYLLRNAIAYHLPGLRDIDYESIDRGVKFLCAESPRGPADLVTGLYLLKEQDMFWLATWQADLPGLNYPAISPGTELLLQVPSKIELNDGWTLRVSLEADSCEALQKSRGNTEPFQAWMDADDLELPLILRSRKAGERFQPLGMHGHSLKVSDLMVNHKMPKRARATWPLLLSGKTIVWIPGCRQGQMGGIDQASRKVIHLTLSRSSA